MNLNLIDPKLIALAVAVVLVIVVAVALYMQKCGNTTAELRRPEYDRAVKQHGSDRKAEAKPTDRETRDEKLRIPVDRWQSEQAHVVDYPKGAVTEANESVVSLMQARGRGGHLRYYARATRWTQAGPGATAGLAVEDKLTASLMTRHRGGVC